MLLIKLRRSGLPTSTAVDSHPLLSRYMALNEPLKFRQIVASAKLMEVGVDYAVSRRHAFLAEELKFWRGARTDKITSYVLAFPAVQQIAAEIEQLKKDYWRYNQPVKDGGITDEMVETAKAFPVDQLVDLTRGRAPCIKHGGTGLNMSRKNNWLKCFKCGWKGDSIEVVMLLEGLNFHSAVNRLCNYA